MYRNSKTEQFTCPIDFDKSRLYRKQNNTDTLQGMSPRIPPVSNDFLKTAIFSLQRNNRLVAAMEAMLPSSYELHSNIYRMSPTYPSTAHNENKISEHHMSRLAALGS